MTPTLQLGTDRQHALIHRLIARRPFNLADVLAWHHITPQAHSRHYWTITPAQASIVIGELL